VGHRQIGRPIAPPSLDESPTSFADPFDPLRSFGRHARRGAVRRLSDEEREIRRSAGIHFNRWWPAAIIVVAVIIASSDVSMLERCIGKPLDGGGRGGAWVRVALAYPCSPFLRFGSWGEWLLLAALWLPIPFGVLNWRWLKRHEAYWDRIRQREKERRAAKRRRKDR
jgi:hypothetical protein